MNKRIPKGKLALNKTTITTLNREYMNGVIGCTADACESMVFSCDPEKYLCDTSPEICEGATEGN